MSQTASGAMDCAPLLSVVIPTYDSAELLARALQSLAMQTFREFEVIVSDGASADDTVRVAERYAAKLPALRIDSRPDNGVYDAINLAVRLARGAWFIVLGSDDRIHSPDTLAQAAPHLRAAGVARLVYGDVRMMPAASDAAGAPERYAGPMPLKRLFLANICQQAIFYRRELFDALGGFDLRYRLYADWHFNLRTAFIGPTRWIDLIVADYATTGMTGSGKDEVFLADLPGLIRAELFERADDPASWPLQDHLLRCANRFRKRGHWREAFEYIGSYFRLVARRAAVRMRPRTAR